MENQTEKNVENETETLGPLQGVYELAFKLLVCGNNSCSVPRIVVQASGGVSTGYRVFGVPRPRSLDHGSSYLSLVHELPLWLQELQIFKPKQTVAYRESTANR